MRRHPVHLIALGVLSLAGAVHAADDSGARRSAIEQQYHTDRAACDSLAGNAKDVCVEEAKGKQKVARAELEAARAPDARHQQQLAEARADASYAVAKERCDDLSGNSKDVCVKDAKAAHTRTLADAKAARETSKARTDAAKDKNDASYAAAAERCDSLAGDAKDACINEAKTRFGKR